MPTKRKDRDEGSSSSNNDCNTSCNMVTADASRSSSADPQQQQQEEDDATTTAAAAAAGNIAAAAARAMTAAKAELASLSRVSHRLAMVDTTEKLSAVLDKLLPRLLKRIGENHQRQQQQQNNNTAAAANNNNNSSSNSLLLHATWSQIHAKLVEMLSHTMKRVRDDAACQLPCLAILQLLLLVPTVPPVSTSTTEEEQSPSSSASAAAESSLTLPTTSNLAHVDAFTLNLALAFLAVGVPRCGSKECCESLLPALLVLLSDSRRRQQISSIQSVQQQQQQQQQQHFQIAHFLLATVANMVHKQRDDDSTTTTTITTTTTTTTTILQRNPASTATTTGGELETKRQQSSSSSLQTLSGLDVARELIAQSCCCGHGQDDQAQQQQQQSSSNSNSTVAAATYDLFLDVLLYQPPQQQQQQQQLSASTTTTTTMSTTIPPAGLSQSGADRLKFHMQKWSSSSVLPAGNNHRISEQQQHQQRSKLVQLKIAVLDLIAPSRRFGLFLASHHTQSLLLLAKNSSNRNTSNRNDNMNLARTVSLLVVATGDPVADVAERASAYLKQHLDAARGMAAATAAAAPRMVLGDALAVAIELTALCLGQAHADAILTAATAAVPNFQRLSGNIFSSRATTATASASQQQHQQILASKRRPVDESTVGAALVGFVSSKILNEYPNLFQESNGGDGEPAATMMLVLASLAVQVASRSLSTTTTTIGSLTRLRAKPYMAAAELLSALAIRLSVHYDDSFINNICSSTDDNNVNNNIDGGAPNTQAAAIVRQQQQLLLARCMSTACGVLVPIASTAASTASASSNNNNRVVAGSNDGSIAVRDSCYGVIATLSRSQFAVLPQGYLFGRGTAAAATSSFIGSGSSNNSSVPVVACIDTAAMLFGCAANEEERLRPRAVAALDALLAAYCRAYKSSGTDDSSMDNNKALGSLEITTDNNDATVAMATESSSNPWITASTASEVPPAPTTTSIDDAPVSSANRAGLAKALLPLIWTAAQTYQPKASRVAASRWASDLLKELELSSACHLLCFLAGDTDVTAAAIARDGLGLPKHAANDDDIALAIKSSDYTTGKLPEFCDFAERLFPDASSKISNRLQRYWDFSLQGKAATLRCGLYCLLNDLYGGDDSAVALYLSAITETLREITGEGPHNAGDPWTTSSQGRASVDLLDECSACLLATLSASKYARLQLTRKDGAPSFLISDIEVLALKANSSRSRRYFAGAFGKLLEDLSIWSSGGDDAIDCFGDWVSRSQIASSLATCAQSLTDVANKHATHGRLHGSSFLGAHVVRAFRLRAASTPTLGSSNRQDDWWGQVAAVLESLGKGILHDDDIVSNACADSLRIALSYDDTDAPVLDVHMYQCTASILSNLAKALKKFGHSDTVNPARTSKIARAAGICLAATTTGTGDGSNLGLIRLECVEALLDLLGSMAFRKEEEIGIVVGEALAAFADAYSPENVVWSHPESGEWPAEFTDSFANQLPPHEQVLYVLLRKVFASSSPQKRTACAPALLAVVARGACRVNADASASRRSLVKSLSNHLEEVQKAFLSLLSDPKGKQFSRECSCLGLAACRGLVKRSSATEPSSGPSADELNHRLLRAFGQTTNFGGSAMMESQAQAAARRATQGVVANGENTDAAESEVGGASGIGEAALGAYREMASASVSLGRHDIMYALLFLSVSHPYWLSTDARHRYSASSLLGESSFVGNKTSTFEFRNALRPHLGKLLPRILRACHDPNKQTREQMSALWTGLTGGGAEGRNAISQHLLSTIDTLIQDGSSKLWRARVGACGALSEIIVGREWSDLGGGGPILSDDDLIGGTTVTAGIRLLRIWKAATRALDDVQGAVRDSGETLARAARALTIRLCDPSIDQKSNQGRVEIAKHERDATAAAATSLRWLIRHGLNQTCPEATGVCVSTLVEVVGVVRPKILEPSLPALLNSLLMAMSALEPAALNYLQLRTSDQEGLERMRLQLAQTGPLAVALTKCLALIPFVTLETQQRVAPELDSALRQSAGFATRAATADAVSTLCSTCPSVFRFSGSLSTNPSVRLLRAFYFASERERGAAAKDKMIHALGNLAALCPASSVRSLALRACERYRSSTGNNFDPASRRAAAAALRTIAVRAPVAFSDGGSGDIWCTRVLPAAYLGRKDDDPKIASLWQEVWDEGGSAANLSDSSPSMNSFGTRLEEKLLSSLVSECVSALQDVSWSRRVAGASALIDLCEIGILSPAPRSVQSSAKAEANAMLRARSRAKASSMALQECVRLLTKPRLWKGKVEVLKAATQLASKWAGAEASIDSEADEKALFGWSEHGKPCPWLPLAIAPGDFVDDLCAGDGWFSKTKVESDSTPEEPGGTPLSDGKEDDANDDQAKIDFEQCDDILEETENSNLTDDVRSGETTHSAVTFTGFCRFLIDQAVPSSRSQTATASEELLPYRTTAFRCFRDLVNSLPPACVEQRIEVYKRFSPTLLRIFGQGSFDKDVDKREPPVLTAGAISCVEALFWDGIGSTADAVDCVDPNELTSILKEAGGKLQPAWTVREAAAQCLAQLALKCNDESIRRHVVVSQMVDSARQALTDRKFWRVRVAGLKILESLTSRAGTNHNTSTEMQLNLEALLPHKEVIVQLVRSSLSDSEAKVTALSSGIITNMTWWP